METNPYKLQEVMLDHDQMDPKPALYSVLDCAHDTEIYPQLKSSYEDFESLFRGDFSEKFLSVTPHLVRLTHDGRFTISLLRQSWGRRWGIFFTCKKDMDVIRRHLRKFLLAKSSHYKKLFFRFYDPIMLPAFLESSNQQELIDFFGPILTFYVEDPETLDCIAYQISESGDLQRTVIPTNEDISEAI